jgi:hypothetical protein
MQGLPRAVRGIRLKSFVAAAAVSGLVVLTGVLAPAVRAATTWYVAPGGTDSPTCSTPGSPCASIQLAISNAADGDTINVAAGTYHGTSSNVASVSKSITLQGGWSVDSPSGQGHPRSTARELAVGFTSRAE